MTQHGITPQPRRRMTRRRVFLCFVLLAVVSHHWWLRAWGVFLVAEQPIPPSDVAIVLGGDHRLQHAAALLDDQTVSEIWLMERRASYAVSVGILPPTDTVETEQLRRRGIPAEKIRVLSGGMQDVDDAARMIVQALRDNPATRAVVLCDRLQSRNFRLVLTSVTGESPMPHVSVMGISHDRYDENNWWQSRTGWKGMFNASCQLAFTVVLGVHADRKRFEWDADDYEWEFLTLYGGTRCYAPE